LGHHFQKNRDLDNGFSTHVFGIVPGSIFNGFWVLPIDPRRGKSIEIHATKIKVRRICGHDGFEVLPESILH